MTPFVWRVTKSIKLVWQNGVVLSRLVDSILFFLDTLSNSKQVQHIYMNDYAIKILICCYRLWRFFFHLATCWWSCFPTYTGKWPWSNFSLHETEVVFFTNGLQQLISKKLFSEKKILWYTHIHFKVTLIFVISRILAASFPRYYRDQMPNLHHQKEWQHWTVSK